MLTDEHKMKWQASALTFLTRYSEQGDDFLNRTVTGDETWVSHVTPESKQQSIEWRHTSSPIKKKFKQTISTRKIMCTVFWDSKGFLLVEFLPQGSTIHASVYCDTLKKLRREIQNKRRGMLSRSVVMLHDNVRPHTSAATHACHLKTFPGGRRFHDDEIKEAVNTWFASQAASIYDAGIQKVVPLYKCLNNGGNYVEK
jgi:hypothetical protein